MRKILILLGLFLLPSLCFAKDTIDFKFPNEGWHKVDSPDKVAYKKCFVPHNQSAENYTEMLVFVGRKTKTAGITPMTILHKQLGKDKLNYPDIEPEYIKQELEDSMIAWCSQAKNTCTIKRAFQGKEGVVIATYINRMPHYSQNMFGQWSNILGSIKVYNNISAKGTLIEL